MSQGNWMLLSAWVQTRKRQAEAFIFFKFFKFKLLSACMVFFKDETIGHDWKNSKKNIKIC